MGGRDAFKAAIRNSLKGLRVFDDGAESTTGEPALPFDGAALSATPVLVRLPGRNTTKADVVVFDRDGRRIAVKDYGPRPLWVRLTIGRFMIAREAAAYRALAGIDGLPRCHGRVGPYALALDWIDAKPLAALVGATLSPSVFDALDRIVGDVHAHGVALGDLHHRDVLVGEGGSVHVVDLATAWVLGPRPGAWRRFVFQRLRGNDLVSAARLRARFTAISEAEALASVPAAAVRRHASGRNWKRAWNRLRGRSPSR